jgi:hypothetical protein
LEHEYLLSVGEIFRNSPRVQCPGKSKRAQSCVDSKTNFHFAAQMPTTNGARGRFGFWGLASLAVIAGLVVGEVYPMHAFGPSDPNGKSINLKIHQDFGALQISPGVPQKNNAEFGTAKPSSAVQKPEKTVQPPTAVADGFVPLPRARPQLQIVRYSRYYYVRTVDQGDADGRLTFHIERRLCKSPHLPPICFEPLSVRHETILDDF